MNSESSPNLNILNSDYKTNDIEKITSIMNNMSQTFIDIMQEIINTNYQNITLSDFIYIFIKDDRLLYVGLLLVLISFSIYLLEIID
jgi:hypothetical protein